MSRRRTITVSAAALTLLAGAAYVVPHGTHDGPALAPAADQTTYVARTATAAGRTTVTPAIEREIDRVVAAGRAVPSPDVPARRLPLASLRSAARTLLRCATFEGQRYCLGVGWTTRTQTDVRHDLIAQMARAPRATTGDLGPRALVAHLLDGTVNQRARRERAELTDAAQSVAKVWLLRHELQGVALPTGFLARHPEARTAASSPAARVAAKTAATYPEHYKILSSKRVSEQHRTYWCGPTTAQMIIWGWKKKRQTQKHWANRLGTTTSGSSISDMVRVVNNNTGWDGAKYAGKYIVLDIGDWSAKQWWHLVERHISKYHAPVILHPVLLKKYYPYLDDNASGHFQVGRGYDRRGKRTNLLGYFEPWNQQRFDPSEPYIARVQWRNASRSYRANEAHFQHNIGV